MHLIEVFNYLVFIHIFYVLRPGYTLYVRCNSERYGIMFGKFLCISCNIV
jgi:hypothetical protein